ncbi:signal peptide peptidase SppA [Methanolobus sp. WCC1]|uniref:Signal peptide protein peptidase A n=1 Tax=Methanolobus tindarius DSM 2278 TaxID=1090322 RepID=W9DQE2_METTI|nr:MULTISPECIES: signal peptide peptidase SppA [Methanolobus]ETA67668.1 signal peptide protein peptidase A [Methanolobus tindarius DSM 2278]MDK2832477.1 protease [Methanolobus sp.]
MEKSSKILIYGAMGIVILILALTGIIVAVMNIPIEGSSGEIAVIDLDGTIYSGGTEEDLFSDYQPGVEDYIEWIEDAQEDDGTKAILIRINSPGGEAIASEKLARAIKEASEKKVVVAYVESMAASAAYQAASSTDYIVAEKQSLVGNIGVRMEIIHYYGLMDDLGINVTTIKSGEYKDIGSPTRPMTEEEKEMLGSIVNESYDDFVSWVAENRNMSLEEAYKVADGRIYSGSQAKKAGLVDMVGTEEDAIDITAEMAGITGEPDLYEYEGKSSGFLGMKLNDALYSFGYGFGKGLAATSVEEASSSYGMYF